MLKYLNRTKTGIAPDIICRYGCPAPDFTKSEIGAGGEVALQRFKGQLHIIVIWLFKEKLEVGFLAYHG